MDETLRHFNPNPLLSANCFSKAFFCWLNPLLRTGRQRALGVDDLYNVPPQDTAQHLGVALEREWQKEVKKREDSGGSSQPSLLRALCRLFGLPYLLLGLLVYTEETVRVVQPLLLGGLIQYFSGGGGEGVKTQTQAYLYALGVSLCAMVLALTHHLYFFTVARIGMQMRVACNSLIFSKVLQLNNAGMSQTTTGHIINLMSNDVSRFDKGALFLHYLVIGPLQAVAVLVILWQELGPSVVGGFVVLILLIPVQGIMGRIFSKLRHKTALHTDERVKVMNEIIAGMRVIKMYCWEKLFGELVETIRRWEVRYVWAKKRINAFTCNVWLFAHRVLSYAVVVTHVALGGTLRAASLYVALSFMFLLAYNSIGCVFEGVSHFSEFRVASVRIQKFLLVAEEHKKESVASQSCPLHEDCMVCIDSLTAKWSPEVEQNTLEKISASVGAGQLLAVIGPVGAGKSSLLMAILGELQASSGRVSVKGKVAYVSQQAWVFSGSLRQNVLFGSTYDKRRFDKVVRASALRRDLEMMPEGDSTLIGDRGVSLSGGQRARVSLARALYREADVYLLDDPLSAVDTAVGHHIFQRCIQGMLGGKPRILVTHQLQYLTDADCILILKEGKVMGMGTFEELSSSGVDFAELLKTKEDLDDPAVQSVPVPASPLLFSGGGSQVSLISAATDFEPEPVQVLEEEERERGQVGMGVYLSYFRAGMGVVKAVLLAGLLVAAQASYILSDWWLSRWSTAEEDRLTAVEEHHRLLSQGHNQTNVTLPEVDRPGYVYVYTGLIGAVFLLGMLRALLFFRVAVDAAKSLHYTMLARVLRCHIHFFDTNPVGRILNRFAKDIDNMDDKLPINFFDFLQCLLLIVGIVLVVGVVNPWVFIPTLPILLLFSYIRHYYLSTSRSVKRLEAVCRSPVFSYLSASLQGLHSIRAFDMEDKCRQEFCAHQDRHSEAWLLFLASSRWLASRLDWLCALFVSSVTFCAVFAAKSLDAGLVGLSVTYSMTLMGLFQWAVRQSAEVENQMISVERVLEYSRLPSEAALESSEKARPPGDWPCGGAIQAADVSLQYSAEAPVVLKNISFHIRAREKVGIVGRTGAGKSSLITALFRLVEPRGQLTIDGVDVRGLGLHDLRGAIAIIPQDPVLFTGSVRKNLDPFLKHMDHQLWTALDQVQMKCAVEDLPCGLQSRVAEGGVNFSVGQRQLLCLARAILRQNRILVVDEATANVDPKTDALIQQTIRDKFMDCTVLTIAHRLQTIMDCHRVMVMCEGQLVEMDAPHVLLRDRRGLFHSMVQQAGRAEAQDLAAIAAHAFNQCHHPPTHSRRRSSNGFQSAVEARACRDSVPFPEDSVPFCDDEVPFSRDDVPISQDDVPFSQDDVPFFQEDVPFCQDDVPFCPTTAEEGGTVSRDSSAADAHRVADVSRHQSRQQYDMNLSAPIAVAESFHSLLAHDSEVEESNEEGSNWD